jgi:7,8-dihydropterin-6-yl-methyl-4-(beta-D-ribofuranosyl)aminobenzene 5'-phosphate synthase
MTRRQSLPGGAILAVLVGSVLAAGSSPPATDDSRRPRVASLKIVVLSTMLADRGVGEWGFSAYVEADGTRLLFDTGARARTVLENARELGIDLARVDTVVLSHNHGDHTGGLLTLRRELATQEKTALSTAHVGRGIFWPRPNGKNTALEIKDEYEKGGGRFVEHAEPAMLAPGVWLTGPVPRPFPEKNWSGTGRVASDKGEVEDTIPEDESLVFDTDRGLVVLSGCGHAGIVNTATYARKIVRDAALHALVGGFHLFPLDDSRLDWTADQLRPFGVQNLVGAHCTGIEAVYRLRERLGLARKTAVVGAVGASFSLDGGIDPRDLAR